MYICTHLFSLFISKIYNVKHNHQNNIQTNEYTAFKSYIKANRIRRSSMKQNSPAHISWALQTLRPLYLTRNTTSRAGPSSISHFQVSSQSKHPRSDNLSKASNKRFKVTLNVSETRTQMEGTSGIRLVPERKGKWVKINGMDKKREGKERMCLPESCVRLVWRPRCLSAPFNQCRHLSHQTSLP